MGMGIAKRFQSDMQKRATLKPEAGRLRYANQSGNPSCILYSTWEDNLSNAENVLCDWEALNGNKIPFDRIPFEVHVSCVPEGRTWSTLV